MRFDGIFFNFAEPLIEAEREIVRQEVMAERIAESRWQRALKSPKPWVYLGVSRSTFYRWKKQGRDFA